MGINTTIDEQSINWSAFAESEEELPYDVMLTPGDPTCFGNDPDLLMTWWYGDNVWTQGRSCWKGTEEWTQLQDLLQQAREASGDDQQNLWNQCFDLLAEQVPLYPLFPIVMSPPAGGPTASTASSPSPRPAWSSSARA